MFLNTLSACYYAILACITGLFSRAQTPSSALTPITAAHCITIDSSNIAFYSQLRFKLTQVTHIIWRAGKLDAHILSLFPNAIYLDVRGNGLTDIRAVRVLRYLIIFDCSDNEIVSLNGLQGLYWLKVLICENNRLTTFKYIENCIRIQTIIGSGNSFDSFDRLKFACYLSTLELDHDEELGNQLADMLAYLGNADLNPNYGYTPYLHDEMLAHTILHVAPYLTLESSVDPYFTVEQMANTPITTTALEILRDLCSSSEPTCYTVTMTEIVGCIWRRILRSPNFNNDCDIFSQHVCGADTILDEHELADYMISALSTLSGDLRLCYSNEAITDSTIVGSYQETNDPQPEAVLRAIAQSLTNLGRNDTTIADHLRVAIYYDSIQCTVTDLGFDINHSLFTNHFSQVTERRVYRATAHARSATI